MKKVSAGTAILVTILALTLWHYTEVRAAENRGANAARTAAVKHEIEALRRVTDSLVRTFRAETVHVARTVVAWKTAVDTFKILVPTTVRESVFVARAESIFVRADTAIQACTLALRTCSQIVASKDSLIIRKDQQIYLIEQRVPSRWRTWLDRVTSASVGFTACKLID
jgi:hypothetical protein